MSVLGSTIDYVVFREYHPFVSFLFSLWCGAGYLFTTARRESSRILDFVPGRPAYLGGSVEMRKEEV